MLESAQFAYLPAEPPMSADFQVLEKDTVLEDEPRGCEKDSEVRGRVEVLYKARKHQMKFQSDEDFLERIKTLKSVLTGKKTMFGKTLKNA